MSILNNIEPKGVFGYFEELCSIPHGSGNTKKASDWLVNFANAHNLWSYQDAFDNVIIRKPATKGYENAAPVILQCHIDMVCEKAPDCAKDMNSEGLDIAVDGDYVYAEGTTLGGDDGIAVAMVLEILASNNYEHPKIEAVFTSDEEIGLIGATNLDMSMLNSKRMINIDSEAEGIFTVGCAGGNRTECVIPVTFSEFDGECITVKISGLLGGHSGVEINKGRANANILLGKILSDISNKTKMRIVSVDGGLKDNAIPRESIAVIKVASREIAEKICKDTETVFKSEYKDTDSGVSVCVSNAGEGKPFDLQSTDRIITFLTKAPNGIIKMCEHIDTLVQTSLNLGILKTDGCSIKASFGVRSSVDKEKAELVESLNVLAENLSGSVSVSGDYPGWDYTGKSQLENLMTGVFQELYGYAPKIVTIHAGLECGLFSSKIKGIDCISIGPDIYDIHTHAERLSISSVQRVFKMLIEVLKQMNR